MAESSRLLSDVDGEDQTPHVNIDNDEFEAQDGVSTEHIPASARFKRPSKILTIMIAVCSALTVALLITIYVTVTIGPFNWYIHRAQEAAVGLGIFVSILPFPSTPSLFHALPAHSQLTFLQLLISFVVSIINLRVNVPVILNVILDIILVFGILIWEAGLVGAFPGSNWCSVGFGYPQPALPHPEPVSPPSACNDSKLLVMILIGIASGLGGLVGYVLSIFLSSFEYRDRDWISMVETVRFR